MADRLEYAIRPYDAAVDEAPVLELLQQSLGGGPVGQRTVAFFRWKHEQNPFGRSFAFVADAGGEIVGFRTFMRWRWRTAARSWEAVRAVDTATHPDHQGQGIFKALTLGAVDGIRGEIDLIFNTPNESSRPGYLKMGWTQVGTVPIAIRPIHPLRLARGFRKIREDRSVEAVTCDLPRAAEAFPADDEVAELLTAAHQPDDLLATDRSAGYLRWRYADAPGLDYRVVAAREAGRLTGLAFARARRRGPLAELTLSEVIVAAGDTGSARAVLRAAIGASGCDHVATVVGPDPALAPTYRRSGFLTVPGQGTVLTTNPLVSVVPDPVSLASWRFALGDLEVF
ncbi:MAG: hypothetical protein JWM89_1851 [Acidimicrobiales bacterium]|nr:hypothetical protein [Acidimicrobiales bacterium]